MSPLACNTVVCVRVLSVSFRTSLYIFCDIELCAECGGMHGHCTDQMGGTWGTVVERRGKEKEEERDEWGGEGGTQNIIMAR